MDDEELLAAWKAGDRKAGNTLFERYHPVLQRFFANKVDSPQELEDLVQSSFLGCVSGRERIVGTTFRPYLFGIARNQLRKHWARRRVRGRPDSIDELSLADLGAGPSTALTRDDEQRIMLEALRRIPLVDQELLEAYYWEGLTGVELAALFGISENTLRTHLRAAKRKLAAMLKRLHNFPSPMAPTSSNLETWARSLRGLRAGPLGAGQTSSRDSKSRMS